MRPRRPLVLALVALAAPLSAAVHPELLVAPDLRPELQAKLRQAPWAVTAFAAMKQRVDAVLAQSKGDPVWLSSRLAMNWTTHYTVPLTRASRWVGGEGHAPVPTPRFAGARDWAADVTAPDKLADLIPYNDDAQGRVRLLDKTTGQPVWIDPGRTGRVLESINDRIVTLASEAAFLYWLSGDEAYAALGGEVLWTYLHGFSYVEAPRVLDGNKESERIIGVTSFEVIHEGIIMPLALCYDFLHDRLRAQGRDLALLQTQFKRFADRVIAGGERTGNWNLHQAMMIGYAGLVLEEDETYADRHGRGHYLEVLLHADLPNQLGLIQAMNGFDARTALWPEAPGYGFAAATQFVMLSALAASDPAGRRLLDDPFHERALTAQRQLLHPDGWSIGWGDTNHTRLQCEALELLIAAARRRQDAAAEARFTAVLTQEIAAGDYDRAKQSSVQALITHVGELATTGTAAGGLTRSFQAEPLALIMQRNPGVDADHGLSAALFATAGKHAHANGLAIELFGAGVTMGADPGRGSSYWQKDHAEYYSQPPAHNTVIVNGRSTYPAEGAGHLPLRPDACEPAFGQAGVSAAIGFASGRITYTAPVAAEQHRLLALIRLDDTHGFYIDVMRSRAANGAADGFHDYLYHNVGQAVTLDDGAGTVLALAPSQHLAGEGLLPGYRYFRDEASALLAGTLHATFSLTLPTDTTPRRMAMWQPGAAGRQVFRVTAPGNRAARSSLPKGFSDLPMPTVLVRQTGDAWASPFVTVYEPYHRDEAAITAVQPLAGEAAGCHIDGHGFTATVLADDDATAPRTGRGLTARAALAVVLERSDGTGEWYLGQGRSLHQGGITLAAVEDAPLSAALRRTADGWTCTAAAPVRLTLTLPAGSTGLRRTDPQGNTGLATVLNGTATLVVPPGGEMRMQTVR